MSQVMIGGRYISDWGYIFFYSKNEASGLNKTLSNTLIGVLLRVNAIQKRLENMGGTT